tara:strand:+ start:274 stop:567 length:294 start_codon:yes stop_codon:yes gene_type:complete
MFFIHIPEDGILDKILGKTDKIENGKAKANPKPDIAKVSSIGLLSFVIEPTKSDPSIGPVQEKETIARVKAIKNIPMKLFDENESVLLDQEDGSDIS